MVFIFVDVPSDSDTSGELLCAQWHIPSQLCLNLLMYLWSVAGSQQGHLSDQVDLRLTEGC